MSRSPFPQSRHGLVEFVLVQLTPGPEAAANPERCPQTAFVPCSDEILPDEVIPDMRATNGRTPSALLFGINPRSAPRSGDPWVWKTLQLAVREPPLGLAEPDDHQRFRRFCGALPSSPTRIGSQGGSTYYLWGLKTERHPEDVTRTLVRLSRWLGPTYEVSSAPSYMVPAPGSWDWSTGKPHLVTVYEDGSGPIWRNMVPEVLDQLGAPELPEDEYLRLKYRVPLIPLDLVPDSNPACVVRFREQGRGYVKHSTIGVEVVEGRLLGHRWAQSISRKARVLDKLYRAAGCPAAWSPDSESGLLDLVGLSARASAGLGGGKRLRVIDWCAADEDWPGTAPPDRKWAQ